MNANEIVVALRERADAANKRGYSGEASERYEIIDLIESLQARADQAAMNYQQKCRDVAELEAQLAASQRREKAAVDSLKRKCLDELAAVKCICDIETYLDLGSPKYIAKTIKDWRGPQAGEGERDE